jgi:chemotaxis protein methyltransferase CheR
MSFDVERAHCIRGCRGVTVTDSLPDREFAFSSADFEQVRSLLYRRVGISLSDAKESLVYGRLSRRLRELGLRSFREYLDYLQHNEDEWQSFTNALTTNLTAFFRENHHFDILAEHLQRVRSRPVRIWCAAASTGEEPYSIAITAAEAFGSRTPPVSIMASDVDTGVLEIAQRGVYPVARLDKIPVALKRRWFQRGKGRNEGKARVVSDLQRLLQFRQINLLDRDWRFEQQFDVIFCRNVMIYFDKPTQQKILERMLRVLKPGGLYFAGHSESFSQPGHSMRPIGRTVYQVGTASGEVA